MNISGYASRYSAPNTKSVTSNTNNNAAADTAFASKLNSTVTEEASATPEDKKMISYYQGVPMEEWAKTDPKYTDPQTGISWYVRDGKHPYMIGEDAEKFEKLCEETGEFPVKKFAELTGLIQQLDENTVAYIGENGIAVEGKDGRELFVDTSDLTYDMLMDLFDNLSGTGDYFNPEYWKENVKNVYETSSQNAGISFSDLMNSQYARNKIPTINQIVSSKSPVDGELYRVYFTNDRISCNHADGKRAWEVEINEEQQAEKIKEFFEGYTPNDNWANNEYYSGDNISMAVLKTFWLDLFKQ